MQQQNNQIEVSREELEASIAQCKERIKWSKDLKELEQNPTFDKLFLDIYLNKEPARITGLMMDATREASRISKETLQAQLMGISAFRSFCLSIHAMAESSENELIQLEKALHGEDDSE